VSVLQKYKHATGLVGDHRFVEATHAFKALLQEEPQMTDVWIQLAGLYERRGMTGAAVDAFKEVVTRNPRDPSALIGVASGLMRLGKLAEARAHGELAREVAPAAAHELLARIAVEQGDAATARREADLTHAADSSVPMPPIVEGLLLHKQGQYALAVSHFEEARRALTARTVQMPDVHYYLADCLARLERNDEAERYFSAEIGLFPNNLRARAGLAMLYRATGREAQADQAIADLIRISPTREGYDLAAQLWTMFGDARKAAAARAEAGRRPG
jgi:tetratricopeptide (TPR) repeat protein